MEFIPLCCDMAVLLNVLLSIVTTLCCLYQQCYMVWSFSQIILRHKNTYLKHKYVCQLKFASSQIVQSCFQFCAALSGECLFTCVCHKLKYFSKSSCVCKSSDSFLWLKYSAFLMCIRLDKVYTPETLNVLSK